MKKLLAAIAGLLFSATIAAAQGPGPQPPPAQWGTNGSNLYYNLGNVGVGTPAPAAPLDVKGSINIDGFSSGAISLRPQANTPSYNLNLPTGAGNSGDMFISGGGGSAPTFWLSKFFNVATNVDAFRGANFTGYVQVFLQGWHYAGDQGGGMFNAGCGFTSPADNGGTILHDALGNCFTRENNGRPPTEQQFGSYGDGLATSTTATISSTTLTIGSGQNTFLPTDYSATNPKVILISGAGAAGAWYKGVIVSYISPTQVTVSPSVSTALSSTAADVMWAHDDSVSHGNFLTFLNNPSTPPTSENAAFALGGEGNCPQGMYFVAGDFRQHSNTLFKGFGSAQLDQTTSPNSLLPAGYLTPRGTAPPSCQFVHTSTNGTDILFDMAGYWAVPINGDSGTVVAGAASTVTLRAGASSTNNFYQGGFIQIGGSCSAAGQIRDIGSYVGSTKVATVTWPWTVIPTSSCTYSFPSHAVGDQFTGTFAPFNALAFYGQGNIPSLTNVVAARIENVSMFSPFGSYAGIRRLGTVHGGGNNLLIVGFKIGAERISDAYAVYSSVLTRTLLAGVTAYTEDHVVATDWENDGYARIAMTSANQPWLFNYMGAINYDGNPLITAGEYHFFDNGDRYIGPRNEGGPRQLFMVQMYGDSWIGSHVEQHGGGPYNYFVAGGTMVFNGGDTCEDGTNSNPVFTGNSMTLTIISTGNPACSYGLLIDPGLASGSTVRILTTPPLSLDVAPVAGSTIDWDAWYGTHYSPTSSQACTPGSRQVMDGSYIYNCLSSGAWARAAITRAY